MDNFEFQPAWKVLDLISKAKPKKPFQAPDNHRLAADWSVWWAYHISLKNNTLTVYGPPKTVQEMGNLYNNALLIDGERIPQRMATFDYAALRLFSGPEAFHRSIFSAFSQQARDDNDLRSPDVVGDLLGDVNDLPSPDGVGDLLGDVNELPSPDGVGAFLGQAELDPNHQDPRSSSVTTESTVGEDPPESDPEQPDEGSLVPTSPGSPHPTPDGGTALNPVSRDDGSPPGTGRAVSGFPAGPTPPPRLGSPIRLGSISPPASRSSGPPGTPAPNPELWAYGTAEYDHNSPSGGYCPKPPSPARDNSSEAVTVIAAGGHMRAAGHTPHPSTGALLRHPTDENSPPVREGDPPTPTPQQPAESDPPDDDEDIHDATPPLNEAKRKHDEDTGSDQPTKKPRHNGDDAEREDNESDNNDASPDTPRGETKRRRDEEAGSDHSHHESTDQGSSPPAKNQRHDTDDGVEQEDVDDLFPILQPQILQESAASSPAENQEEEPESEQDYRCELPPPIQSPHSSSAGVKQEEESESEQVYLCDLPPPIQSPYSLGAGVTQEEEPESELPSSPPSPGPLPPGPLPSGPRSLCNPPPSPQTPESEYFSTESSPTTGLETMSPPNDEGSRDRTRSDLPALDSGSNPEASSPHSKNQPDDNEGGGGATDDTEAQRTASDSVGPPPRRQYTQPTGQPTGRIATWEVQWNKSMSRSADSSDNLVSPSTQAADPSPEVSH